MCQKRDYQVLITQLLDFLGPDGQGINVSYLRTFLFTSALRRLHQKLLRMRGETIFLTVVKNFFTPFL